MGFCLDSGPERPSKKSDESPIVLEVHGPITFKIGDLTIGVSETELEVKKSDKSVVLDIENLDVSAFQSERVREMFRE